MLGEDEKGEEAVFITKDRRLSSQEKEKGDDPLHTINLNSVLLEAPGTDHLATDNLEGLTPRVLHSRSKGSAEIFVERL